MYYKIVFILSLCFYQGFAIYAGNTEAAKPYDSIVVGVGASGATALSKLARHGHLVLGLEAADRVGGRVRTVPFGNGLVEMGAEWIHGRNNSRTYELALANNISIKYQDYNLAVFRNDGTKLDEKLLSELLLACLDDDNVTVAEPMGEFYTRQCTEYIKNNKAELLQDPNFLPELLFFLNPYSCIADAVEDWNDVSTFSRYQDLDEYIANSWHSYGYKTLFDIILNNYNNGPGLPNAEIKLNTEVSQIVWSENPTDDVIVKCVNGEEFRAKNVIVTLSVGVLKAKHNDLFVPPLPQMKVDAINQISIGVVAKILLSYKDIWWPKDKSFLGFFWSIEDREKVPAESKWITKVIGPSRSMGADNVLELWITGEGAKQVETMNIEVLKNQSTELLRRFFGNQVPEPEEIMQTNWYSNPYTRGSYTYDNLATPLHPDAREHLGTPILDTAGNPRVLFAGEATNLEHFSTVHGAFETGIREANRILGDDKLTLE